MRVLLDTDVVVSAPLFGGEPRRLIRRLCGPGFELWTSRQLLRELATTLRHRKLRAARARCGVSVDAMMEAYANQVLVVPDASLPAVRFPADPRDEHVLAAALAARAEWLITGDKDLLAGGTPGPFIVLSVTEALGRASRLGGPPSPPER